MFGEEEEEKEKEGRKSGVVGGATHMNDGLYFMLCVPVCPEGRMDRVVSSGTYLLSIIDECPPVAGCYFSEVDVQLIFFTLKNV